MRILLILVLNIRAKSPKGLKVVRAGGAHVEKDRAGHGPKHHCGTSWMSLSQAGNAPACSFSRFSNFKGSERLRRRLKGKKGRIALRPRIPPVAKLYIFKIFFVSVNLGFGRATRLRERFSLFLGYFPIQYLFHASTGL